MINLDLATDGHIHTAMCHHACGTMEEYIESALAKGLERLIFLEHFEVGINYFESTWLSDNDFMVYFQEGRDLKEKYAKRIEVGIGVEIGYNPARVKEIKSFIARYEWDRVGLSYHFLDFHGRHINMLSSKKANLEQFSKIGIDWVIKSYLTGLLKAARELPVEVVCHLDAALRHHPEVRFNHENQQIILEILQVMASRGLSLEINTSGFAHRGEAYPAAWIIKKAMELGINFVAGSDSHNPKDVGRFFYRLSDV